jgi:mannose-6-phosphate isomerase-like protein (cupin superfamily)
MSDRRRGINSENASHNLDAVSAPRDRKPDRGVGEADFAAEAHGFTGFEKAGRGSGYAGARPDAKEKAMSKHVLKGESIETGPLGDLQLAQGERSGLRIWQDYVTEDKAERKRSYEIVGYVATGEITVVIDGTPLQLVEGDSFVIPPDTSHRFSIKMPATVIESTAPPASRELG